jgi:hypothetical protein
MQFWMGVLLVIGAAGEGRVPEACLIRVGMRCQDVQDVLGMPKWDRTIYLLGGPQTWCAYRRNDWLGGQQEWRVHFDRDQLLKDYNFAFHPFTMRPPWLQQVLDSLASPAD